MLNGFLVWHCYKDGKIVSWSTTHFEATNEKQLAQLLKDHAKEFEERGGSILHQIVFLP